MAANLRAEKAGLAREVHARIAQKFDPIEAAKTIRWIHQLPAPQDELPDSILKALNRQPADVASVSYDDYHTYLCNGLVLGYLMGTLSADYAKKLISLKSWQVSDKAIFETSRQRERIGYFIDFTQAQGVLSQFVFQTDQLYEKNDLNQVVICLAQLGIESQSKPDYQGPSNFWLNKTKENIRNFTEEQRKAGNNIVSLQMGYNGGANAAGVTFGSRRHIV